MTFYPAAGPLAPRWGYDYQVYGWSPDGKSVLFRSLRYGWDLGDTKLFLVEISGGLPRALPMPESGGGDLSPDARRVVYSPVTRDFRHWKVFDLASGAVRPVPIHVPTDQLARRPSRVSAANLVSGFSLSPKAKRAAFSARGDIFTVPVEHGPTRNLTRSSGANDRDPAWSPDGRRIAFVSDQSGETEIWAVSQNGSGEPVQLTDGSVGRHYNNLLWSPKSDRIAFDGLAQRVARVPVEADNYFGLGAAEGKVLYVRGGAGYLGRSSDVQTEVFSYDLEKREGESLARGIGPRLRRRRGLRGARAAARRPARRPLRARRGRRPLPDRPHLRRAERRAALPLAADRSRRRHKRWRLPVRDRRPRTDRRRQPVPVAA